jgi:hypothetical protein
MKYVDKILDYLSDKVSDLREFAESFEEDLKYQLDNETLPANQTDDDYVIDIINIGRIKKYHEF